MLFGYKNALTTTAMVIGEIAILPRLGPRVPWHPLLHRGYLDTSYNLGKG